VRASATTVVVLVFFVLSGTRWISPGLRAHEAEFRRAWVQHFGAGEPPKSTYKAWYKQWKRTGISPPEWIATLGGGAPRSRLV
jgi:hypothetical protein